MPPDAFASDPRLTPFEDAWDACVTAAERRAVEDRVRRELPDLVGKFLEWVVDATRIQAEELAKRWRDTTPPERMDRAAEFRAQLRREYGEPAVAHFNEVRARLEAAESTEVLGPFDIVENFARWELRVADGVVYHLDDRLGSGGMAVVGKARRADNRDSAEWPRLLVCKIWGDEKLPGVVEALHHETGLLTKALSGPHVVRCVGSGVLRPVRGKSEAAFLALPPDSSAPLQPGDCPCLLLGFTPGAVSLAELLATDHARWKNDPRLVLRFLSEAAKGFVHLHDTDSVAHGDVKPANFLVHLPSLLRPEENTGSAVQFIDFGVAQRVLKARGGRASTWRLPDAYSPPEVKDQELRFASDLFGLGLTAVELLSGCDIHAIHAALPSLRYGLEPGNPKVGLSVGALFDFILAQHTGSARYRLWVRRAHWEHFLKTTLITDHARREPAAELAENLERLAIAVAGTFWPPEWRRTWGGIASTKYFTRVAGLQDEIEMAFARAQEDGFPLVHVLRAPGGFGKTTQADHYFRSASGRYSFCLWTNARSADTLKQELREALFELDPKAAADPDTNAVQSFRELFRTRPGWLWVLNNFPDDAYDASKRKSKNTQLVAPKSKTKLKQSKAAHAPDATKAENIALTGWIREFLPASGHGHILITTRFEPTTFSAHFPPLTCQPLELMAERTAFEFLMCRSGWKPAPVGDGWVRAPKAGELTGGSDGTLADSEQAAARALVSPERLDRHPLCIEFAGAKLEDDRGETFAAYLRRFQRDRLRILEQGFNEEVHDPQGVANMTATFLPLIEHVQVSRPAAAALLHLSAVLACDSIPIELLLPDVRWPEAALNELVAATAGCPAEERVADLRGELRLLAARSLIQLAPNGRSWSVLGSLQDVVRRGLAPAALVAWQRAAAVALYRVIALDMHIWGGDIPPDWRPQKWGPQIRCLLAEWPEDWPDDELGKLAETMKKIGDFAMNLDEVVPARTAYQEALKCYRIVKATQTDDPVRQCDVSGSLESVGDTFLAQGQADTARQVYQESLDQVRSDLRASPVAEALAFQTIAVVAFRMGNKFCSRGEYEEAKFFYHQSVEGLRRALDFKPYSHVLIRGMLIVLRQIGFLTMAQEGAAAVEPVYREILGFSRAHLAAQPDNPDRQRSVLVSLVRMVEVLAELGRKAEAQPLAQEAASLISELVQGYPDRADYKQDAADLHAFLARVFGGQAEEPPNS